MGAAAAVEVAAGAVGVGVMAATANRVAVAAGWAVTAAVTAADSHLRLRNRDTLTAGSRAHTCTNQHKRDYAMHPTRVGDCSLRASRRVGTAAVGTCRARRLSTSLRRREQRGW